jgi:hypothetical protein
VSIATDQPQDLTRLGQGGVRPRGAARSGSSLQRLVEDLAVGVRAARPPGQQVNVVRYQIERFDFYLHPESRPPGSRRPRSTSAQTVPPLGDPRGLADRYLAPEEIVVHSKRALPPWN